jgi:hypothetical protein
MKLTIQELKNSKSEIDEKKKNLINRNLINNHIQNPNFNQNNDFNSFDNLESLDEIKYNKSNDFNNINVNNLIFEQKDIPEKDFNRSFGNKKINYNNKSMYNFNNIINRIDNNYNLLAKNYLNKGYLTFK